MDDITPRGPNLKLRKRYRQMIENELEFDRLAETAINNTSATNGSEELVSVIVCACVCLCVCLV